MSSRKLSDSDKIDIIDLYRKPGETTLTLASRYGVSSSTISRILKSSLSEHEYETLIQEKRSGRVQNNAAQSNAQTPEIRRKRKRSSMADESETLSDSGTQLNLLDTKELDRDFEDDNEDDVDEIYQAEASTLHEMLGEDMLDEEDLDEDEDEDEDDYDELEEEPFIPRPRKAAQNLLEIIPLQNAALPRPCYVVVDRGGELITRPLGDFSELGKIAVAEFQQRTLPVF